MTTQKPVHKSLPLLTTIVALTVILFPGCAGYRLGSMLPPDIKTVYVPTFINNTMEPQLELETTRYAMQEFQKDGSLKIGQKETADAILEVRLTQYRLTPVQYNNTRLTAATQYRITLNASILLTRRSDHKVIVEYPRCLGEAYFPVVGDLSSSKLVGLPIAAQDLAHDIVQKVTEVW